MPCSSQKKKIAVAPSPMVARRMYEGSSSNPIARGSVAIKEVVRPLPKQFCVLVRTFLEMVQKVLGIISGGCLHTCYCKRRQTIKLRSVSICLTLLMVFLVMTFYSFFAYVTLFLNDIVALEAWSVLSDQELISSCLQNAELEVSSLRTQISLTHTEFTQVRCNWFLETKLNDQRVEQLIVEVFANRTKC